jgi:hypothetical protein
MMCSTFLVANASAASGHSKILAVKGGIDPSCLTRFGRLLIDQARLMRGNQLPVSASMWQHGFQICLATFI